MSHVKWDGDPILEIFLTERGFEITCQSQEKSSLKYNNWKKIKVLGILSGSFLKRALRKKENRVKTTTEMKKIVKPLWSIFSSCKIYSAVASACFLNVCACFG